MQHKPLCQTSIHSANTAFARKATLVGLEGTVKSSTEMIDARATIEGKVSASDTADWEYGLITFPGLGARIAPKGRNGAPTIRTIKPTPV